MIGGGLGGGGGRGRIESCLEANDGPGEKAEMYKKCQHYYLPHLICLRIKVVPISVSLCQTILQCQLYLFERAGEPKSQL